ncbi:terpenoid synthase [Marasmius fiardii PR-910]|nr:terpenoid synthase [Marasmius fiardii PR-910]
MSTSSLISSPAATQFQLPDLISYCKFDLRISRHREQIGTETRKWLCKNAPSNDLENKCKKMKIELLTAMAYSGAGYTQIRVCNDFITYLFHLDDLSDDMDSKGTTTMSDVIMNALYHPERHTSPLVGKLTRDYWKRMTRTASPGTQRRFIEGLDLVFQCLTEETQHRISGQRPYNLEAYISLRRHTGACKPAFAMIEYAYNLMIPDEVLEHPLIHSLEDAANDMICWANDLYSYNIEQSKGQTHNMIIVVMAQFGFDLQGAVDYVGKLCMELMDQFSRERVQLPSWGPEIDSQVNVYLDGLADWMVGNLHWSFESGRYFGNSGIEIRKSGVAQLLPRRQ